MSDVLVALVGLGGISAYHQQAYRDQGLRVVAGFDPDPAARDRFATANPDATAHESLDALLADERVGVVDVAVPHHRDIRLPVVAQVAASGLPMLIQKPLAMTYDDALEIVEALESAGTTAMVNQNMCFAPGAHEVARLLLVEKAIGDPFLANVQLRFRFDPPVDGWFGKDERSWTVGLVVHHLAFLHLLFGPPETVFAYTGRDPAQPGVLHDGFADIALRYRSGLGVTLASTGTYYGTDPVLHFGERMWIQGPDGVVDWTVGDALTLSSRGEPGGEPLRRSFETAGRWVPDAFGLVMAHLQRALEVGVRPLCDAADNLYVMGAVEAVYRSAGARRSVDLVEVMGARYDRDYGPGWWHGMHASHGFRAAQG